jgi:hypothetical protein
MKLGWMQKTADPSLDPDFYSVYAPADAEVSFIFADNLPRERGGNRGGAPGLDTKQFRRAPFGGL